MAVGATIGAIVRRKIAKQDSGQIPQDTVLCHCNSADYSDALQRSDFAAMTKPVLGSGESKLETIISYLLILGVLTSVVLITIGIILYYDANGNLQIVTEKSQNSNVFISGQNFFSLIIYQSQRLFGLQNAFVFMTLGLIILILTPYIRAITSVVYFAWEKHYKYVLITLFVLVVLTASLALH